MINSQRKKNSWFFTALVFAWVASEFLLFYTDFGSMLGIKARYYTLFLVLISSTYLLLKNSGYRFAATAKISSLTFVTFCAIILFAVNAFSVSALNDEPLSLSRFVILLLLPIMVLAASLAVSTINPLLLLFVLVFVTTVSATFSILQAMNFEFAWEVRRYFADDLTRGWRLTGRNLGLAQQGVRAAEVLLLGLCVSLAFLLYSKSKFLWFSIAALHSIAIYATGTRSAIIAAVFAISFAYIVKKPTNSYLRAIVAGIVVMLASLIFLAVAGSLEYRIASVDDYSAQVRVLFNLLGVQLVAEQPWGYGAHTFSHVAPAFFLETTMSFGDADNRVGSIESHNYFLNVAFYYGLQGLIILLLLYYFFLRLGAKLLGSQCVNSRFFGYILISGIAAQSIDSFFHNSGLMNGFSGLFLLFSAAIAHCGRKAYSSPSEANMSLTYGLPASVPPR